MTDDSHPDDRQEGDNAAGSNGKAEPEVVKNAILDHLTKNSKIIFKSQQIDDPELTTEEKISIAENILNESHEKFLYRFGKYLQIEHLPYFENSNNPNEDVNLLINDIRDRNECDGGEVPFSNILLDGIDNEHLEKLRKEQAKADDSESEESSQLSSSGNSKPRNEFEYDEELFPRKPAEFKKQWGGFVDDEKNRKILMLVRRKSIEKWKNL